MTDRYFRVARAVCTSKKSPTHMANVLLDHYTVPSGFRIYFLIDNGSQFINESITPVCGYQGTKHLTTTTYHPQTNGQAKPFIRAIFTRLQHYVA